MLHKVSVVVLHELHLILLQQLLHVGAEIIHLLLQCMVTKAQR
jgi:hypothetical protein